MLRNLILSLFVIATISSVNGQVLEDLKSYDYVFAPIEQIHPELSNAILLSVNMIGPEKYLDKVTYLESATCKEPKQIKKFIKKANKAIKKLKVSEVFKMDEEEMKVIIYAIKDHIIIFTNMENELVTVTSLN